MLELHEVVDDIFLVPGDKEGRFPYSHSLLVRGDPTVLVDTGCGLERLKALKRDIRIDIVVHSHSHPDHMSCSRVFRETGTWFPVETPPGVHDFDSLAERFLDGGETGRVWQGFVSSVMGFRPPEKPSFRYGHGHVFDTGTAKLEAVYTPGHCIDHYCFWEEERRVLFLSDLDLSNFGPWYGHRESSLRDFRESIRRVSRLNASVALSSHKPPIAENIPEALEDYEKGIERQRQKLLESLTEDMTERRLLDISPIYNNSFPVLQVQRNFEKWMIRHLLRELIDEGLVVTDGGSGETVYRAV